MKTPVGIRSLAVSFPSILRTNDYYRKKFPQMVAEAEKSALAKLWRKQQEASTRAFDEQMDAFVSDPFQGTVHRRILAPGETPLTLEVRAARDALAAASMTARDIDCLIVSAFLPTNPGIGDSAHVASALEFQGAAWNLETACASGPVALQNAVALVRSGEYEKVLVVVSCTYSRVADEKDSLPWFMGDGAGAFIVSALPEGQGVLGSKVINTSGTCDTFRYELYNDAEQNPKIRIAAHERTGRVLAELSAPYVRACCDGALKAAGVGYDDVKFFVFNTPTAWYGAFCARTLGISLDRTIDTYPRYANIGSALMPVNLYTAARERRIAPGDLVVVYSVGSVSSASAVVMRWGDVALGPPPAEPATVE